MRPHHAASPPHMLVDWKPDLVFLAPLGPSAFSPSSS